MADIFKNLFITKSDVPLSSEGASRFIPMLMGLMIFLATMALLSSVGALHLSQNMGSLAILTDWETIAGAIQAFGIALCCLIAGAAILTVAFVTQSGLALHHQVVHTLLLLGARDPYIALQFQAYAMQLGIRGAFIGNVLTLLVLLMLRLSLRQSTLNFMQQAVSVPEIGFAMLFSTGLILSLIALTARVTVLSYLSRS